MYRLKNYFLREMIYMNPENINTIFFVILDIFNSPRSDKKLRSQNFKIVPIFLQFLTLLKLIKISD